MLGLIDEVLAADDPLLLSDEQCDMLRAYLRTQWPDLEIETWALAGKGDEAAIEKRNRELSKFRKLRFCLEYNEVKRLNPSGPASNHPSAIATPSSAPASGRTHQPSDPSTTTSHTEQAKGSRGNPPRRKGQKLTDEEKETYLRIIQIAKRLRTPHQSVGRIDKIAEAARVDIELVRKALKWRRGQGLI
jgi:hypothetical protein